MSQSLTHWLEAALRSVMDAGPEDLVIPGRGDDSEHVVRPRGRSRRLGYRMHCHPLLELCISLSGRPLLHAPEGLYHLNRPRLAILPAHQLHSEGPSDSRNSYHLMWLILSDFSLSGLVMHYRPVGKWDTKWFGSLRGPVVRHMLGLLADCGQGSAGPDTGVFFPALRADLLAILGQLHQRQVCHPSPPSPARPAHRRYEDVLRQLRSLLDAGTERPVSLDELSAMARLTPRYLNRLFREWSGLPIRQYLIRRRMDVALRLCRQGLMVKEVAYRLGYEDPLYFSRAFHRYHGFSPTQARRSGALPLENLREIAGVGRQTARTNSLTR